MSEITSAKENNNVIMLQHFDIIVVETNMLKEEL